MSNRTNGRFGHAAHHDQQKQLFAAMQAAQHQPQQIQMFRVPFDGTFIKCPPMQMDDKIVPNIAGMAPTLHLFYMARHGCERTAAFLEALGMGYQDADGKMYWPVPEPDAVVTPTENHVGPAPVVEFGGEETAGGGSITVHAGGFEVDGLDVGASAFPIEETPLPPREERTILLPGEC